MDVDYEKMDRNAIRVFKWSAIIVVCGFALVGAGHIIGGKNKIAPASPPTAQAKPPAAASAPEQSAQASDATPSTPPTAGDKDNSGAALDYLTLKAVSEQQLKSRLTDDHGVRYRNVETRLSTLDGAGIIAFCGEVNSKTPLGGYGGFKRFIASRSTAITEDGMTPGDFEQAWGQFCSGGVQGPTVWF